jgi:erythromycin esterase
MVSGHDVRERMLEEIAGLARPLTGPDDLDPLIDRIGGARFVLLGEASHGTAEYYVWRAEITRRLVAERGFSFVAVEGDWPDCFDVNCWVKHSADPGSSARHVLSRFDRWPTWMWANHEVATFAEWLRDHNRRTGAGVGFYGLDVYSLWESMDRVMRYLVEHEPDAVDAASVAAGCFEPYDEDPQRYAFATRMVPTSCEDAVVGLLSDLRGRTPRDEMDEDEFDALQNAEVLAGAERYYRTMMRADATSWNVRDCHMADTLDRLVAHHGPNAKAIVWEHNTHVGDARATDMAATGMLNVGQVVRQRHWSDGVVLVGFGGYEGSVIAAPAWGSSMREMPVPPAVTDSHEHLIHEVTGEPALFVFPDHGRDTPWLGTRRTHRAIGVVYHPERDPYGNWVPTTLGGRYDAFVSFEHTRALRPLHAEPPATGELDTAPWGT